MKINWIIKPFADLTTLELYQALRLREQIFIIEQNCIYPDLDNKDFLAHHILGYVDHELVAYSRIFRPGDYFDWASIGRVVNATSVRGKGIGKLLVQRSIEALKEIYNEEKIQISAQYYLLEFYRSLGFEPVGETYLEDDIPHIKMLRK